MLLYVKLCMVDWQVVVHSVPGVPQGDPFRFLLVHVTKAAAYTGYRKVDTITIDGYREVRRDAGTMDRNKSSLNPRNLIICVTTCTIAAVWAVIFAAVYFYFFGTGPQRQDNATETQAVFMFRKELLPWHLNGSVYPTASLEDDAVLLWPFQLSQDPLQRLQNQLAFLPKGSEETKIVLFWSDWSPREIEDYKPGLCPVKSCVFTNSRKSFSKASAVVFRNPTNLLREFPQEYRPRSQVWVFNSLSMPKEVFVHPRDVFNWTATPRLDSDVPMFPHGIWMYFTPSWKQQTPPPNVVGYKNLGAAAWFTTSCDEKSPAYSYVQKLGYHTLVDVFGPLPCGDRCPQNKSEICLKLLRLRYRVTLVLENHSCNHTIPEMFYLALEADTVPVVMYPARSVYEQVVPEGSFIHTDDFAAPYELAKHLETVYSDDAVFNKYLSWKDTGLFVKSWYCRLCAMLHHNTLPDMIVEDVNQWWNPEGECFSS